MTTSSTTTSSTGTARVEPSRLTTACGATSSESRSSVRFARTSWMIPMPELATMIPRNRASRGSPKINVTIPKPARIRLNTVRTLARTMLAYERLVPEIRGGPASARRRAASASLRPAETSGGEATRAAGAWSTAVGTIRTPAYTIRITRCSMPKPHQPLRPLTLPTGRSWISGSVPIGDPGSTELGVSSVAREDASPPNLSRSSELVPDGVFRRPRRFITVSD